MRTRNDIDSRTARHRAAHAPIPKPGDNVLPAAALRKVQRTEQATSFARVPALLYDSVEFGDIAQWKSMAESKP